MAKKKTAHRPRVRLRWPRPGRLRWRAAEGAENQQLKTHLRSQWRVLETQIAAPIQSRIVEHDASICGQLLWGRGIVNNVDFTALQHWSDRQLNQSIRSGDDGQWLLKTGLYLDPLLHRRHEPDVVHQIHHLLGPVHGAIQAQRLGLKGYVTAVVLQRLPQFRPALSPAAFLQQVRADSIDEPLLSAHLRFGAIPVAIAQHQESWVAVLQWPNE